MTTRNKTTAGARTQMHICDGCGKRENLGPLPKGKRNHYCDCNPTAPFYMVPLKIRKASLLAAGAITSAASGTVKQGRRPISQPLGSTLQFSAGPFTMNDSDQRSGTHVTVEDVDGQTIATCGKSSNRIARNNGRLFAAAQDLLAERQAISKALGEYTWTTPEHAEQILRDFIEKFYDSDAVDKATGTARLDRAVEKMAATEAR